MRVLRLLPVLAITILLGSCDRPDGPSATLTGPQATSVTTDGGSEYTLIEGRIPSLIDDLQVSRLIGSDGGSLSLAGHRITVPANAVAEPTIFTLTLVTNGYVEVELTAVRELLNGLFGIRLLPVTEFQNPVTLELSYAAASNVEDPSDLVILRLDDADPYGSDAELVESELDENRPVVRAQLQHFSRYCMAAN